MADAHHNDSPPVTHRVYPNPVVQRDGLLSILLVATPLLGALYLLTIPDGPWTVVLVGHAVGTVAVLLILARFRATYVAVLPDHLLSRSVFRRARRIPFSRIETASLVETYRHNEADTTATLLLRDARGRNLLTLRGLFWSKQHMREVAAATDTPLTHVANPITESELRVRYPGSGTWFETRPYRLYLALCAVAAIAVAVLLAVNVLAGIPIA